MYEKMTLLEFQERFSTEQHCAQYLFETRWPDGFCCPRCGHREFYSHRPRQLYECKRCRYQCSLTAGTIFHGTRVPLRCWFWMIFLLSRNKAGQSMLGMQRLLGIGQYRTVWMMGHKIRKAMADRNGRYQLCGLVEMDDAYFGGRRGPREGRGAEGKAKVLVLAEQRGQTAGFAGMQVVDRLDESGVRQTARKWIAPGESIIRTDAFPSFHTLRKEDYVHQPIRIGPPEQASVQLPWVHTLISNAKNQLRGTQRGVSLKHLSRYLSEFCYRFNRRFWEHELFDRLLTACTATSTLTYSELRA